MEPVLLTVWKHTFFADTPICFAVLVCIVIGGFFIPFCYTLCFPRIFILLHKKFLWWGDYGISTAFALYTFWRIGAFASLPNLSRIFLYTFFIFFDCYLFLFVIFEHCFFVWVCGQAQWQDYFWPFAFLGGFLFFCHGSDFLEFSDFIRLMSPRPLFLSFIN